MYHRLVVVKRTSLFEDHVANITLEDRYVTNSVKNRHVMRQRALLLEAFVAEFTFKFCDISGIVNEPLVRLHGKLLGKLPAADVTRVAGARTFHGAYLSSVRRLVMSDQSCLVTERLVTQLTLQRLRGHDPVYQRHVCSKAALVCKDFAANVALNFLGAIIGRSSCTLSSTVLVCANDYGVTIRGKYADSEHFAPNVDCTKCKEAQNRQRE